MRTSEELVAGRAVRSCAAKESPPTADVYLGCRLGAYELVERIGEGGMGAVYRARRVDGSGPEVAIKLIKRGMDTDAILRRFENEERILAAIRHPNIARVLDRGVTADGLPYFVMEHIVGQPLDKYSDARQLSVENRLRLFLKICAAVHYAHELCIVHRDIKPENILVTPEGEPKLLDFGIAKILSAASGSQEVTITVGRLMTPRYASPEQAHGGPVTPSSDIYSLGVLMYELLTGAYPYPADSRPNAWVRTICDDAPRRPSEVAAPERRRLLSGNLDAILLTALAKDPERRYRSVAEFAADVARHLEGARARARRMRPCLCRLWQRRRVAAIALFALALSAAGALVSRGRTRDSAQVRPSVALLGFENLSHRPTAEWLSTALTEMLSTELSAGGRIRTVPGELVSRVKLELALPNAQTLTVSTLRRVRRSLNSDFVVLGSYLALKDGGDAQVRVDLRLQDARSGVIVASLSETRRASELPPLVTRAGILMRRELGDRNLAAAELPAVGGSLPQGADAARDYSEGLHRLRTFDTLAARDLLRNAVTAAPGHAQSHAALAVACSLLGYDMEARDEAGKAVALSGGLPEQERLSIQGRFYQTTRQWSKAAETFQLLRRRYPDNVDYGLQLAAAQSQAGDEAHALETLLSLRSLRSAADDPRLDLAEAEIALAGSDLSRARAAARRAAQSGLTQGFRILAARARLLEGRIALQAGDPARALAAVAEAQQLYLSAGHRQGVAWALNESAGVLTQRGDVDGARTRYEEALAICRTIGDQSCIGTDLDSLGVLRRRQGDLQGATAIHREAMEIRRAVGDRAGVATSLYNIGNVLEVIGDLPAARDAIAESLEIRRQLGERRAAALTRSRLGNIRRREGGLSEALTETGQALSELRGIGDVGGVAMAMLNVGLVLFDRGDLARSRAILEEALAIRRQQQDKNNTAQTLAALARVALAQDRVADANRLIAESISMRQKLGETIALAHSKTVLAAVLLAQGDAAASERAAAAAATIFRDAGAWGREAEAAVGLSQAKLEQGKLGQARAAIDSASRLLRQSKDISLLLRRDAVLAGIEFSGGRHAEAGAILDRAQGEAARLRLAGVDFELRLARVRIGRGSAAQLALDSQHAGYLLIWRKTSHGF